MHLLHEVAGHIYAPSSQLRCSCSSWSAMQSPPDQRVAARALQRVKHRLSSSPRTASPFILIVASATQNL